MSSCSGSTLILKIIPIIILVIAGDALPLLNRCKSRRRQVPLFDITTEIRVSAGGSLKISTDVKPLKGVLRDCLSLARVGMLLQLPPGFGHVQWFGKGPFECYQDRKVWAILALSYSLASTTARFLLIPSISSSTSLPP